MRIHDLMIRDVASCTPDTPLDEAVALMWSRGCGFLPVVAGADVVGVITARDVAVCAWRQGVGLGQLRAAQAMSDKPAWIAEEASVEGAEELMRARQVRRLAVLNSEGQLVGVVSLGDLARGPRVGGRSSHRDDVVATLASLARRSSTKVN